MKALIVLLFLLFTLAPIAFAHEGHNEAFAEGGAAAPSEVEVDEQGVRALGIKTQSASTGNIDDLLRATGEVRAAETNLFEVTAPVSGAVRAVYVKQNDTVRKGQSLGLIHSIEVAQALSGLLAERTKIRGEIERINTEYASEITLQEKEVQLTKSEYERQESLFKEGIAAKKAYQEAEGFYEKAKVKLATLKTKLVQEVKLQNTQLAAHMQNVKGQLEIMGISSQDADRALKGHDVTADLPISSPVQGIVTFRDVTVGERVDPSKKLFSIVDLSPIWIMLDVFQEELQRIAIGQSVRVTTPDGHVLDGAISSIDSNVDPEKKTVHVRVVSNNPGGSLRPGTFVQAQILVGSIQSAGVVVPNTALVESEGKHFVYTRHDNHFEPKEVEIGQQNPSIAEITSGIDVGDEVVVQGARQLLAQGILGAKTAENHQHDSESEKENGALHGSQKMSSEPLHDNHGAHLASMSEGAKPEVLMVMMFLAGVFATSMIGAVLVFFRKQKYAQVDSTKEMRTKVDA